MKQAVVGLIIGLILGATMYAVASDISPESLWNKVYNATTNTIKVIGI